ncbi:MULTISPECIES: tripartite tricarboxylate transporter TctB family protein [unclassified Halomonas]|uniref:tripartite tricarboxylate transporter TctB family protein n=1 Tax=unclassified Halomonas TaxID=2609666 RepID=UPI00209FEC81|nr:MULTISPECIES: tripartite tricarboxylate transporter TctB family protein [unclassified Halomonas]MCP1313340.1 tripartite tricarboxylate transporter TctB family protein [Halomonas sp. 707D7]MCP1327218.1 tripartite tricarboxylate transporter TctB family protein [Halomonas sp. 707D4]
MSVQRRDYGDLLVLMALACFTLWYLMDAISVSSQVQNLLLILPLSLLVLAIIALEFVLRLKHGTLLRASSEEEPLYRTLPVVGLFAAYVLSLETLGFDIATVAFIALFLVLKGERNWLLLAGFSVAFGLGTAFFFSQMLPYPMTLLLLPS